MCGKPLKRTALLKRSRQVCQRLSHPSVMVKVSDGLIGLGGAIQRVRFAPLRARITERVPLFAPLIQVSKPPVKPSVSARVVVIVP